MVEITKACPTDLASDHACIHASLKPPSLEILYGGFLWLCHAAAAVAQDLMTIMLLCKSDLIDQQLARSHI